MKPHYLILALHLLMVLHLKAQNDINLYDSWKSSQQNTSWYFSDRPDDDVDRGGISYYMTISISQCCNCKTVMSIPFDWKSKNGKINLYYNINSGSVTVDIVSKPGTSKDDIALAKKNCQNVANESFAEFKTTYKLTTELNYYISGTTLNIEGATFYAVSGVNKVTQQTKVEYKEQPTPAAEVKKAEAIIPAKKNGYHTQVWEDGTRYEGEWKDDKMHGPGTFTSDGEKYIGQWKDNFKNGQGTYTWANGSTYTGEFMNDKPNGYGTHTTPAGDKYAGQWLNNSKSGQGTFTWADGSSYTGQWQNNTQHGQGTYIDEKGVKFSGEFSEGKFVK